MPASIHITLQQFAFHNTNTLCVHLSFVKLFYLNIKSLSNGLKWTCLLRYRFLISWCKHRFISWQLLWIVVIGFHVRAYPIMQHSSNRWQTQYVSLLPCCIKLPPTYGGYHDLPPPCISIPYWVHWLHTLWYTWCHLPIVTNFSKLLSLRMMIWPNCCFIINASSGFVESISSMTCLFVLLRVLGIRSNLLQHHNSKVSIIFSCFLMSW